MAKQTINIGTTANDGTGDAIRAAFGKVNDNFTEIYTANTGVNTGDQNLSAYATTAAVAAGYQPLDSDLTAISALTTTAYGRALLSTTDAATLRSAIGVGTTDAPTFLAQTLTGQSLTGTQATSLVDMAATWNTSGTPTAIKLNVVETGINSNAASNLMDLQVGGVSKVSVRKDGNLKVLGSAGVHSTSYLTNDGTSGNTDWGTYLRNDQGLALKSTNALSWTSGAATLTRTLLLEQDAPGILAQRNLSAAQAFRVYNSTDATPATNYDRASFGFASNVLRIGTENGGTYTTARPIDFVTGGVVRMSIGDTGITTFNGTVSCSSLLQLTGVGGIKLPSTGYGIYWTSSTTFKNVSNGVLTISNFAENDFGRLQLGGTTSAFPAIKRNGTGIDIRLADDSGYANLTAATLSVNSAIATSAIGIGSAQIRAVSNNKLRFINNTLDNFTAIEIGEADMGIMRGSGTPEGAVTAKVGSIFLRTDGGASTTLYVKESSPTPSTGWVAK